MESTSIRESRSPIERLALFIRSFLPAQNLQLLFPLGSFLLLLGASHVWYQLRLPGVFEAMHQQNFQIDSNAFEEFNHSYNVWVVVEEQVAMGLVRFACLASLVIWGLASRRIVSRFIAWVFLPAGLALAAFSTFLVATTRQRNAALDAFITAAHVAVPTTRPFFPTLGEGIYLTVSGLIILAVGLILMRRRMVSLPLHFPEGRKLQTSAAEKGFAAQRDIFVFVIAMAVWTFAESWGLVIPGLLGRKPISWDSHSFTIFQWAPALVNAVTAAGLAFFLLRAERPQVLHGLLRRRLLRDYALALAIPFAVVLVPRFVLGVVFKPYLVPSEWPELFIPHPLPWVLAVYVIAFFEEFAVRGYLQSALEKHFSLNRSIFLTGLLWFLSLGFGMAHSLPHVAFAQFPGVSLLVGFATLIIYSVPLGWLFARTRSIVATALMHGTIVVFHVGLGNEIHLNHPEFYWAELALWVFTGWFLFRKYPLVNPLYAVAIRDNNGLWLLARIRRTGSNVYFLMQRDTPDWDPHASYHTNGVSHVRSYDWTHFETQKQRLDNTFRGVATLFSMGISPGEEDLYKTPCDAGDFDDVFQIQREQFVAGEPHTLVADIIEPGQAAAPGPWRNIVVQKTYKDAVPWILVTLWRGLAG